MTKRKSEPGTASMPMERDMQALIGHRLRARYAEILAEPIPDKFLELLEQLDRPAQARADGASSEGGDAATLGALAREEQRR